MKTLLAHSSTSGNAVYLGVDDDGNIFMRDGVGTETRLIDIEGPVGPTAPKVYTATTQGIYNKTDSVDGPPGWVGLTPAQRGAANLTAYNTWKNNATFAYGELLFDKPGTYEFPVDSMLVPAHRALRGVGRGYPQAVTLQAVGTAGSVFIGGAGSPFTLENLQLDGGGTSSIGADALCDYLIHTAGTLVPDVAGPTGIVVGVNATRALVAAVHGRNASLNLTDCVFSRFRQIGLWSEGCSECLGRNVHVVGDAGSPPEFGILFEGSGAGSATRSGDTMTNGGLWRCTDMVVSNVAVGVRWNGIGGGNYDSSTCEGSTQITYEFIKSTGITGRGNRSNAGAFYASFDASKTISWSGFGVSTQKVRYLNDSRMCDCSLQHEAFGAVVEIDHEFGVTPFVAYRHLDGQWISKVNVSPSDGYWEKSTVMWRKDNTSGQPQGWKCSVNGNPNGGTGVWAALPNMP